MSNPEIARYLEKEHLRDAEENDYHLMEGLIKQHRRPASNTIDIPIPIATSNDHVSCNPYDFDVHVRVIYEIKYGHKRPVGILGRHYLFSQQPVWQLIKTM